MRDRLRGDVCSFDSRSLRNSIYRLRPPGEASRASLGDLGGHDTGSTTEENHIRFDKTSVTVGPDILASYPPKRRHTLFEHLQSIDTATFIALKWHACSEPTPPSPKLCSENE